MTASANTLTSLKLKMQNLREEADKSKELYEQKCQELEREKAHRLQIETDVAQLSRKLRTLEDDLEDTAEKLQETNQKFVEIGKVSDESERAKRALENRQNLDGDRMNVLQRLVDDSMQAATEAEEKYEEAVRKLQLSEVELEQAEDRAETAEAKVKSLDTELHIATSTLKSLEISESKASKQEDAYEATIKDLTARLKDVESNSTESEQLATKLQKEVDRLEEELEHIVTENKSLRVEMDNALQEIQSM